MPYGKYRGCDVSDIPSSYLFYVLREHTIEAPGLEAAIRHELADRGAGIGRSAAELYGMPICGPVGWLLRLAFFLRFMPRRRQALGVVAALVSLPMRGRYFDAPAATGEPSVRTAPGRSAIPVQRAG